MGDKQKAPRDRFSLDEILAEARTLDQAEKDPAPAKAKEKTGQRKTPVTPEEIAAKAKNALDAQISKTSQMSQIPGETDFPEPSEKKKGRKGLFGRRKREFPDLDDGNDIYYGLQLKSIEEYREDYEKALQLEPDRSKSAPGSSVFSYLFQETADDKVDDEIAKRFEKLHSEREKRVQNIMKRAGLEQNELYSLSDSAEPKAEEPKKTEAGASAAMPQAPQRIPPEPPPEPKQQPPVHAPEPLPEMEPASPVIPEITEPYPAPMTPSTPLQPDVVPAIRSRMSEEPVKEPVHEPKVKEELPGAPAVEEPARPVPQSVKRPVYRAFGLPVLVIALDQYEDILAHAAKRLPSVNPKPAPPPIPLPVVNAGEPEEEAEEPETEPGSEPDGIALVPEELEEELPVEQPIPFPENAVGEPEVEEKPAKPVKKKRFHVFGNEEEDNDSGDNLPGEQEELDDYISPDDAASVMSELRSTMRNLLLRFAVTGISLVLLLIFGLLRDMSGFLPPEISLWLNAQTYLIVNLVFLLTAGAFCIVPIANGLKALMTFQANSDSAVAVATVAAAAQNIALLFSTHDVQAGNYHVYSVLVVLALFFNTYGKTMMAKRIIRNFRFVSAPDQKQAVLLFDDHNTALQMTNGCVIDAPVVAYQTKTNFLKNFLRLSYEPDPSEQASQTMAPIGFILSLILCIVSVILYKDVFSALTAFAVASCICVPFVNMLSANLPVNRVCRLASRCGAMAVGYSAIENFSSVNAVMVDAKDLFPKGTVVLNAIKTFGGQRIDDAIVDATALMCSVGGPLSDVFEQIIKSRDMLPKIDNPVFEDDKGVTGWVSGRRILVGSRRLMEAHSIQPPSRDYEEKYIHTGRKIIYLASGGDLVAMFVVSYNSDRRRAMELRRMEDNGISLIVRTCDPNITPRMLGECFGLDEHSIRVLPERLGSIYTKLTSKPQERSPAMLATKGRPAAMMRMLTACVRQRSNISIAVAMQNVAVILGFLLVAFLTCYSGLGQLSITALLIYELFWSAAILLVPKLRKP